MKSTRSPGHRIIRNLTVVLAITILLWSSVEDHDVIGVTALGAMSAALLIMRLLTTGWIGKLARDTDLLILTVVYGLLTGALSSLITVLLMLFKNVRHGHIYPDYPPETLLAILDKLPYWGLAGGLAGTGIGILLKLWRERRNTRA